MVENAEDVPGETKSNFVEISGDVKLPKLVAKPNIDGTSVHVEASKNVDSGVLCNSPFFARFILLFIYMCLYVLICD